MRFSRREKGLQNQCPRSSRSFTLIELLVVIAVIAILAALLVPALSEAKERGNRTECMNNIRQIGFAIEYYKEDHGGRYPIPEPNPYDFGEKNVYMNLLSSGYFNSTYGVFDCPSNKNPWSPDKRTNSLGDWMDYEINNGIWGKVPEQNQAMLSSVTVLYEFPHPGWFGYVNSPQAPHPKSGGINVYFADGHVAWLTAAEAGGTVGGQTEFFNWGLTP